jgi:hypothetical protein
MTPVRKHVARELNRMVPAVALLALRARGSSEVRSITGPEITVELRRLQERLGVLAMETEAALTDERGEE